MGGELARGLGLLLRRAQSERLPSASAALARGGELVPEVVARLDEAEQVLEPGRRWHYSNLAFSLLGEVVERASGMPYARYVERRLLEPLGLARTSFQPIAPTASGYVVEPYAETVRREPALDVDAAGGSAGALWSTGPDLCRWGSFLAGPDPAVLAPETLDEMAQLQAMVDAERWTMGWGLGLTLHRDGERILVGHGGAMPGFLAGFVAGRKDGVAAAVLTNAGADAEMEKLALALVAKTLELEPGPPGEWRPGDVPQRELEGVLGRWWSEGEELVLSYRGGRLEARAARDPKDEPPAAFEPEGPDRYRTVSGREQGELLEVVRHEDGIVAKLYWATHPCTRDFKSFSGS